MGPSCIVVKCLHLGAIGSQLLRQLLTGWGLGMIRVPPIKLAPTRSNEPEEMIPMPRNQWTEEDKSLEGLNRRLCFIIGMACDDKTYIHIKGSANAKVMWERLLLYVEGDQRAKDNKLFNCQRAFDTFKKEPKESLMDCYSRYVEGHNQLLRTGSAHQVPFCGTNFHDFHLLAKLAFCGEPFSMKFMSSAS